MKPQEIKKWDTRNGDYKSKQKPETEIPQNHLVKILKAREHVFILLMISITFLLLYLIFRFI